MPIAIVAALLALWTSPSQAQVRGESTRHLPAMTDLSNEGQPCERTTTSSPSGEVIGETIRCRTSKIPGVSWCQAELENGEAQFSMYGRTPIAETDETVYRDYDRLAVVRVTTPDFLSTARTWMTNLCGKLPSSPPKVETVTFVMEPLQLSGATAGECMRMGERVGEKMKGMTLMCSREITESSSTSCVISAIPPKKENGPWELLMTKASTVDAETFTLGLLIDTEIVTLQTPRQFTSLAARLLQERCADVLGR